MAESSTLHYVNPEADNKLEEFLNKKIPVLDHGYVMLLDTWLDDAAVVKAARKSTESGGKGVQGLLRYLAEHKHSVPFEFPQIYVRMRLPLYVQAQLVRHRTASLVQLSMRATKTKPFMHRAESVWRMQTAKNKMGSDGIITDPDTIKWLNADEEMIQRVSYEVYEKRIAAGVARELARKDLPQSVYTEVDWTIDLHNLLNVLSQRTDSHAQKEIRDYANALLRICEAWVPHTMQAWKDYRRDAMTLSALDLDLMNQILTNKEFVERYNGEAPLLQRDIFDENDQRISEQDAKVLWVMALCPDIPNRMKKREVAQFYDKFKRLWER